jgi:hypothetical protein
MEPQNPTMQNNSQSSLREYLAYVPAALGLTAYIYGLNYCLAHAGPDHFKTGLEALFATSVILSGALALFSKGNSPSESRDNEINLPGREDNINS